MTSRAPRQLDAIGSAGEAAIAGHDVASDHPADVDEDAAGAGYRGKYGRYGPAYLGPVLAAGARETTLRFNAA